MAIPEAAASGVEGGASAQLRRVPATTLLVLAIISVQSGAAFAVRLFGALGPVGTVTLRVSIAAALLLLAWRPRVRDHPRAHFLPVVLFGLSIAGMNLCVYEALARIPLGVAVTLEFLGPLGLAVALSRRGRDVLWAALAGLGVALLAPLTGTRLDPLGVALALAGGGFWATYTLLSARVGRLFPGGSGLALALGVAALVLLPAGALTAGAALVRPALLGAGLGVALLSTVIPFSLEFEALRRLPARTYGVLVSLEPAAAALSGVLLLGQPLTARILASIGCVVAAAIGVTLSGRREPSASA